MITLILHVAWNYSKPHVLNGFEQKTKHSLSSAAPFAFDEQRTENVVRISFMRWVLVCIVFGSIVGCQALSQSSNVVRFAGNLSGSQEVPAVATEGKGTVDATLDKTSNVLKWKIVYSGLSGPARAAHFHGNATAGQNAGVVLGFKSAESPIEGEATLTAEQASNLVGGKWYVNIHTAKNPAGEIRAQLVSSN